MTKRICTKSITEQLREILDKTDAVLIGARGRAFHLGRVCI